MQFDSNDKSDSNDRRPGPLLEPRAFRFDGVPIARTTIDDAVDAVLRRATGGRADSYRLVNAYTLALASKMPEYKSLLQGPGVNLPDGRPLSRFLSRTGAVECHQVRGPSFFELVIDRGRAYSCRHFLLGTTPKTLRLLEDEIDSRFPGADVVGSFSPPFRPLSEADRAEHDAIIRESRPHIVWVGMGTPRQDFEAQRLLTEMDITAIGVGAAFDFTAGTKRQAPAMMRRHGLEWLFRLTSEPRRLGRRYVVGNTVFARLAVREFRQR